MRRFGIELELVAPANVSDPQAHSVRTLEFRQAAGTCNADKVVGWVKFLQEMISEVVRRSTGVNFNRGSVSRVPEVETETLPGRAPNMREGSNQHTLCERFRTTGIVSTEWARSVGIAPHVLRSLVSGLRKHGAQIETTEFDGVLGYQLSALLRSRLASLLSIGLTLPMNDIFIRTVARQSAAPEVVDPIRLMSYGLYEGLSEETRTWVNQRRAVFSEDIERISRGYREGSVMYDHPPAPPPMRWVKISHKNALHIAERYCYAAYGSNLDLGQMSRRCPQAEIIGPGVLPNARLVFEQVATIVADERSTCPVGVYRLNAVDVASMDRSEGLGRAYDRYLVTVEMPGALLRCFTYIKKDTRLGPPSQSYYDRIRSGYRQWGFDEQRVYRAARKARDLRVVPKHNFDHGRWPWEPLGTMAPRREDDERIANTAPRIRLDESMSPLEFKNEVMRYSAAKRAHAAQQEEFHTGRDGQKWRKIGNGPWERI